jgi:hypothetical protein
MPVNVLVTAAEIKGGYTLIAATVQDPDGDAAPVAQRQNARRPVFRRELVQRAGDVQFILARAETAAAFKSGFHGLISSSFWPRPGLSFAPSGPFLLTCPLSHEGIYPCNPKKQGKYPEKREKTGYLPRFSYEIALIRRFSPIFAVFHFSGEMISPFFARIRGGAEGGLSSRPGGAEGGLSPRRRS